jgi:hypothetical protein
MKRKLLSAVAIVGLGLWGSSAQAVTVSIGLQENAGGITNEASSNTGIVSVSGLSFGNFTVNATGTANPPLTGNDLLEAQTLSIQTTASGSNTLDVFVTVSGLTGPVSAAQQFLSGLTSNILTPGWTVQELTLLSASNQLWGLSGTQLASNTFNAIGNDSVLFSTGTGAGPYSLTAEFIITTNGSGNTNDTIDISAVPLPAALPLLATGLVGLWGVSRRRKAPSVA